MVFDRASCGDPHAALERNRHGRACPGHPRSFVRRARTWMPGTSARSKASSPRPGMTVLELVDGAQNYSLWVWVPDAFATLTCQTSRRHRERSEAIQLFA